MSKIFVIAALAIVASARPQQEHGHAQGHAYSSQSIVLHQSGHGSPQKHQQIQHVQPIVQVRHEPAQHVVSVQPKDGHRQGHGHAFSSQSIVLHQSGHGHEQRHHVQPVVLVKHQPAHQVAQYEHHQEEHYAHPKYEFEYKVQDPHTGDNKYHHESRDGDVVKGVYSLHEADGTVRIVEYTADKHSGFNAVVKREGHAKHIEPQKIHSYHH